MSNPLSTAFEQMPPQEKLRYILSIQTPTDKEISFLISILTDSKENEMIQAAVLPVFKKAGENASAALTICFGQTSDHEKQMRVKLSYALSQIPQTAAAVFETFLKDTVPEVRQNGIIGLSEKNNGQYDSLLYDLLIHDSDPKTAFEAASALAAGNERTLPLFKKILANDLENTGQKTQNFGLDDHVLGKIIEIVGKSDSEEKMMYINPYLYHENVKISNLTKEIIAELKNKNK